MANLVIVESPAKASTIKNYLGSGYKVVASRGHVRDLPKSTLGIDIDNNFDTHYINIRGKGPLIKELKKEVKNANKIFLATDPDREGEAISWHLSIALNLPSEKIKRVTFNEITKTAVKNGIKNPRQIDMNLVNSQQARRILDRILGYKLSNFLWKSLKNGLSAGRVQSVATRILVEREEEIRNFKPEEYWTIETILENSKHKTLKAKFYGDENGRIDLDNENDVNRVLDKIRDNPFVISNVRKTLRLKNPTPPFTTSTMQQEASKKLGFQSQRIMKIAQELYEGINLESENGGVQGLISYMRTDSLRISAEAAEAAKNFITDKYGEKYYPETPNVYKSKSNSQDAHEAIRPSNMAFEPDKIKKYLTSDQYKLYKLIWSRFVASQMAPAELDTVTADISNSGYLFRASGYTVRFQGYMAVYEETESDTVDNHKVQDDDGSNISVMEKTKLPDLAVNETLSEVEINPGQHFTEPPPRYTEASLIKFFEEKGIGRPSTYTPIITTIISRGYVNREGKSLVPTPLGEVTTKLMKENFPDVVDYKFTAQMEDDLDGIENGDTEMLKVLEEFYNDFKKELDTAAEKISKGDIEVPVEETDIICDKCGSRMILKTGRYGKFAACPNYPTCKNTKPLTKNGEEAEADNAELKPVEGEKCEKCGSDMVMRTGRYGSFLACINYPECKTTKRILKDIGVACPECGSKIVVKHGRNKSVFYSCEKYPECTFSSWDIPVDEKCPECGKMLFRKPGKNLIICHNKECGYSRETEKNGDNDTSSGNTDGI